MSARPRLLLVDDEEGIRRVLSVFLADFGYEVLQAPGGAAALELLEGLAPDELPSIVLTDIKMPGLDGLGLLEEVKKRWPHLEVLMLTGHGDMDVAVASLQRGAGDFLHKPVSELALEVSLGRARERLALREALRRYTEDLESLVEQRSRELLESERFAAVGEAAAQLAHSIKNIAGGLEGTMFVLERGISQNKREYLEEGWEMIKGDVGRLKALAVGLLNLGRAREHRFAACDPDELLREVAGLYKSRAAKSGINLEIKAAAGSAPFSMAREAAHQCLCNLVLNAIEALEDSPPKTGVGQVFIRSERKITRDRDLLCYRVSDNGPGLPEGFDKSAPRFASSKEGGSGIGLFATRKLAHEVGGALAFESGPQGTEAILELEHSSF